MSGKWERVPKSQQVGVVKLSQPLRVFADEVTEIPFRAPKAKDLFFKSRPCNEAEASAWLFANVSGLARMFVEELPLADFVAVQEAMAPFANRSETTSVSDSPS